LARAKRSSCVEVPKSIRLYGCSVQCLTNGVCHIPRRHGVYVIVHDEVVHFDRMYASRARQGRLDCVSEDRQAVFNASGSRRKSA
jgi:hypothetical protein